MGVKGWDAAKASSAEMLKGMPGAKLEFLAAQNVAFGETVLGSGTWKVAIPAEKGSPQVMQGRASDVKALRDGKWGACGSRIGPAPAARAYQQVDLRPRATAKRFSRSATVSGRPPAVRHGGRLFARFSDRSGLRAPKRLSHGARPRNRAAPERSVGAQRGSDRDAFAGRASVLSEMSEAVAESEGHPVRRQRRRAQRRVRGNARVAIPRVDHPVRRHRNLNAAPEREHECRTGRWRGETTRRCERRGHIRAHGWRGSIRHDPARERELRRRVETCDAHTAEDVRHDAAIGGHFNAQPAGELTTPADLPPPMTDRPWFVASADVAASSVGWRSACRLPNRPMLPNTITCGAMPDPTLGCRSPVVCVMELAKPPRGP